MDGVCRIMEKRLREQGGGAAGGERRGEGGGEAGREGERERESERRREGGISSASYRNEIIPPNRLLCTFEHNRCPTSPRGASCHRWKRAP